MKLLDVLLIIDGSIEGFEDTPPSASQLVRVFSLSLIGIQIGGFDLTGDFEFVGAVNDRNERHFGIVIVVDVGELLEKHRLVALNRPLWHHRRRNMTVPILLQFEEFIGALYRYIGFCFSATPNVIFYSRNKRV